MLIACKHTLNIDTKPNGFAARPMSIVLTQQFDIAGLPGHQVEWTRYGIMDATVLIGDAQLWEGNARDLPGWLATEAANALLTDDFAWDVTDKEALEMLENEADEEQHQREHAAGRV